MCPKIINHINIRHYKIRSDCHGLPDGYYPDPYSCVKYWICQGGAGYHQQCPPDQYYEPVLVRCDWSWAVECGSRPPCNECLEGCP